jgi:hypothetical protein
VALTGCRRRGGSGGLGHYFHNTIVTEFNMWVKQGHPYVGNVARNSRETESAHPLTRTFGAGIPFRGKLAEWMQASER